MFRLANLPTIVFCGVLLLFVTTGLKAQQEVVLGVSEIPFLLSRTPAKQGPYNRVLSTLAEIRPFHLYFMPPARAEVMFDHQNIDCLFPASKATIPNSDNLIQSEPLTTAKAYLFSLEEYTGIEHFAYKNIAIRRGFTFGNIRQTLPANYIELENEQSALQFLQLGRADAVIGYLSDMLGAKKLLETPLPDLFYHTPIYTAQEAIVCHDTPVNRAFIDATNPVFRQYRPMLDTLNAKPY